jgi:hypothetical protein
MDFGNITTNIIKRGLVFNMDPANRACYPRTGTTATDTIGNITGTIQGSTPPPQWENTNGGTFCFDGTNDRINLGDSDSFSFGNGSTDSPFSLSAWINMTDATKFRILNKVTGVQASSLKEYLFSLGSDDKIIFYLYQDNESATRIGRKYNGAALTSYEGQWIYLVGTYDGSSNVNGIKIYLNGIRVDDLDVITGTYTAMQNTTSNLGLGVLGGSNYANGKIASTHIYNRALSASEVLHNYNALKGRFE